jgi:hypothetical protein
MRIQTLKDLGTQGATDVTVLGEKGIGANGFMETTVISKAVQRCFVAAQEATGDSRKKFCSLFKGATNDYKRPVPKVRFESCTSREVDMGAEQGPVTWGRTRGDHALDTTMGGRGSL